jgi:hypothetical protein
MSAAAVSDPPIGRLLVIFVAYGGWLLVLLTGLFWYWSGAATLGLAYLVLLAPALMIWVAVRTQAERDRSSFHRLTFQAAAVYPPAVLVVVVLGTVAAWLADGG